jgi:hypothetical protein
MPNSRRNEVVLRRATINNVCAETRGGELSLHGVRPKSWLVGFIKPVDIGLGPPGLDDRRGDNRP